MNRYNLIIEYNYCTSDNNFESLAQLYFWNYDSTNKQKFHDSSFLTFFFFCYIFGIFSQIEENLL